MRWRGALMLTSTGLLAFLIAPASGTEGNQRVSAVAMAKLRSIARNVASVSGDSRLSAVTVVRTSGKLALATLDHRGATERGASGSTVYVISMTGNFVGKGLHHPPGTPAPTGTALEIMVNSKTFWVLAIGLSNREINLSSLGRPFPLSASE